MQINEKIKKCKENFQKKKELKKIPFDRFGISLTTKRLMQYMVKGGQVMSSELPLFRF